MIRRDIVVAATLAGLLGAGRSGAQERSAAARIGLLFPGSDQSLMRPEAREQELRSMSSLSSPQRRDALLAGLRDLGWIEGRNLSTDTRFAGVDPERQREASRELKALGVALIVAPGSTTIRAAHEGAPGLPIVMINAGDPVGAGFVASLSRPGGDLTGTSAAGEEVLGKQLELLAAAVPRLKQVGVLMNRANQANDFFFRSMSLHATRLRLQLERLEVSSADELPEAITRAKGSALIVLADPLFGQQRLRLVELIQRAGVPSMFGRREFVATGGLMSYVSSDAWHWRKAATFVDKILRGAKPADLPVEQPTVFEFTINAKAARTLGLTMPQALLLRADEVIE